MKLQDAKHYIDKVAVLKLIRISTFLECKSIK